MRDKGKTNTRHMQDTDDKDKDEAKTRQRQDNMKALKAKGEMLLS